MVRTVLRYCCGICRSNGRALHNSLRGLKVGASDRRGRQCLGAGFDLDGVGCSRVCDGARRSYRCDLWGVSARQHVLLDHLPSSARTTYRCRIVTCDGLCDFNSARRKRFRNDMSLCRACWNCGVFRDRAWSLS